MTEKQSIDCLFLTGMHRSGISALAQCLDVLGVNFSNSQPFPDGIDVSESTAINDVSTIHDIFLRDLGCKWDMVGALPHGWDETQAANNARQRIRQFIEASFKDGQLWAVADPRLCRIMPLWLPILEEKRLNPGIVLTIRHPWEVALSVTKFSEMDIFQGHLLWLVLNKDAFDFCQQRPHAVAIYDQLLADPVSMLDDLKNQFDLKFPNPLQQQIHRILDVIRPERKHHHMNSLQKDSSDDKLFSPFAWLYDQIKTHRSALKLLTQDPAEDAEMDQIAREAAVPTRFYPDTLPGLKQDLTIQQKTSQKGNKIFHSFLTLIGRYERAERDLQLQKMQRILRSTHAADTFFARISIPSLNNDDGPDTAEVLLAKDEWQQAHFPIPHPERVRANGLSLSPLNTRGVVSISSMSLVNTSTGKVCWQAATPEEFDLLTLNDMIRLPGKEGMVLMTTENQSVITLPPLSDLADVPMEFQLWLKVDTNQHVMAAAWQTLQNQKGQLSFNLDEALSEQDSLARQVSELKASLEKKTRSDVAKEQEIERLSSEVAKSQSSISKLSEKLEQRANEIKGHERSHQELTDKIGHLETIISEQTQAIDEAKININTRFQELATLTRMLDKKETESSGKSNQLASHEERIKHLNADLSEKTKQMDADQKRIDRLSSDLSEKAKQTTAYEAKIRQIEAKLDEMNLVVKSAKEENANLKRQLMRREKALQAKEVALDMQRRSFAKLEETAPWKRLAPIRVLTSPFKKRPGKAEPIEEQIERIRSSELFDADWYLDQYPDVAQSNLEPAEHYFHFGALDGRDPGPKFDTAFYIRTYPDVVELENNPLVHYIKFGKEEGRRINTGSPPKEQIDLIKQSNLFDEKWYLDQYPDVAQSNLDPVEHYFHFGLLDGRNPGPDFNTAWYVETYEDVAKKGINPLVHYLTFGEKEGRSIKPTGEK